jgi:hypothetical protein
MLKSIAAIIRRLIGSDHQPRADASQDQPTRVLRDTLAPDRVDAIIGSYSALLDTGVSEWSQGRTLVCPESLLPASRTEIEESIFRLGRMLHRNGQLTQDSRETLRHCYSELAHFIPDDLAHGARAHSLAIRERRFSDIAADNGLSTSVLSSSIESSKLRRLEFDDLMNEKIRRD